MTISDSTPIQWWEDDEETYNQKQICGVYNACFCNPFNCDDLIVDQFTDETGLNIYLVIYDTNNNELTRVQYEEVSSGVYQVSFTPSELSPAICETVRFERVRLDFAFGLSGALTDLLEEIEGEVTFIPEAELFSIEGDVTDLLEQVDGIVNILTEIGLSNNSLDIQITNVEVQNVNATLVSGSLPLGTGSGATMSTKESGSAQDIEVHFTVTIAGQHITLTDSDGNIFCQNSGVGSPMLFSGCVVKPGFAISIEAADGTC